MSSLAASRADNFYFPPEWRPEMGGISKFQGSTGANQYEKYGIIRFELPFDGWCLGCGRHMSKGLRFNAKKEKAGKYHSTTIYSFDMKCYSCEQRFLIKTDPQNRTYDFASGLRKHEQDYEANEEEGIVEVGNDETRRKLDADPMFKLQHMQEDDIKARSEREHLEQLEELQADTYKNDYDRNSALRKLNRNKRKLEQEEVEEGKKRGLNMRLVQLSEAEKVDAFGVRYRRQMQHLQVTELHKRAVIQSQSIFNNSSKYSSHKHTSSSVMRGLQCYVRSCAVTYPIHYFDRRQSLRKNEFGN